MRKAIAIPVIAIAALSTGSAGIAYANARPTPTPTVTVPSPTVTPTPNPFPFLRNCYRATDFEIVTAPGHPVVRETVRAIVCNTGRGPVVFVDTNAGPFPFPLR